MPFVQSPQMKKDLKTDGLTPIAVAAQLSDIEILDIIKILQKQGQLPLIQLAINVICLSF